MAIAIRLGKAGQKTSALFYVNVVTSYTPLQARAQVSKYPLDAGVSITDHVVNENPVVQLSGIITPADISLRGGLNVEGDTPTNVDKNFSNNSEVEMDYLLSGLKEYLPDIANQFLNVSNGTLEGGKEVVNNNQDILKSVFDLFTSLTYNSRNKSYRNSVVLCTLYELNANGQKRRDVKNLVLTEFTGKYDPDHGDALLVDMTFERVRFVNLQQTTVPTAVSSNISQAVAMQSKETQDKGRRDQSVYAYGFDSGQDMLLNLGKGLL